MKDFNPDWLFPCTCGDRTAFGVVHMKDEPCYRPEERDGATGEKHMNAGVLAQARRLYLHVLNGGTLTPEDVSFMVVALEKAYEGEEHMTREQAERFVADFYGLDVETSREVYTDEIEAYMRLVDRRDGNMNTERIYVRNVRNPNMKTIQLIAEQVDDIVIQELKSMYDGLANNIESRINGDGGVYMDHDKHKDIAIMRGLAYSISSVLDYMGVQYGE